jgi:hypothetical protein
MIGEQAYRRGRYVDAASAFATAYGTTPISLSRRCGVGLNRWNPHQQSFPGLGSTVREAANINGTDAALLDALTGPTYPRPQPARQHSATCGRRRREQFGRALVPRGCAMYHRFRLSGDSAYPRHALDAFVELGDRLLVSRARAPVGAVWFLRRYREQAAAWQHQRVLDSTATFPEHERAISRKGGTVNKRWIW